MESFDEMQSSETGGMALGSSERGSVEDLIARPISSVRHDEKNKIVQNDIQSILDGLCRCQDEVIDVHTSNNLCWKFILVVVLYYCDIYQVRGIYFKLHGTVVHQLHVRYLVSHEELGRTKVSTKGI